MSDNPAAQITPPLVAQIVSEYVKKNQVALADISTVINTVYQSLVSLGKDPEPPAKDPAVPIRQAFIILIAKCARTVAAGNCRLVTNIW